jgi:MoaA/NifB/PqqE/SkfB family radical SAM enzyme
MCDSWKMESPDDLTLTELETIFRQLPTLDAVRLTGGEPFVRKDMIEIAKLVQRYLRPLVLHVTSNGFLTDRIVQFCEQRPRNLPLHLLISVDGVEEKHNYVRGRENAWKTATKTLQALAPRRKELRLRLGVNQTIVDAEGVDHYRRLRDFLKPLGIHNNVVMAYDASATYNLKREVEIAPSEIGAFTTFGEFTEAHIRSLAEEIERDLGDFPILERLAKRYYLQGITNRLLGRGGIPNPKCVALNAHLRMFPNGDVPTCQFNSKTIGNLRHQTFKDVWSSAKAGEQRSWVHACPGCWAECEVLPSAIYTGDLLKETLWPSRPKGNGQSSLKVLPSAEPSGVNT